MTGAALTISYRAADELLHFDTYTWDSYDKSWKPCVFVIDGDNSVKIWKWGYDKADFAAFKNAMSSRRGAGQPPVRSCQRVPGNRQDPGGGARFPGSRAYASLPSGTGGGRTRMKELSASEQSRQRMKRSVSPLIVALALLVTPAIAFAESPPVEGATIAMLGYGTASAVPDSVRVRLHVTVEPTYGPGGPELAFVELADLEVVREALVKHGVDADAIEIDQFSSSYRYGPSSRAGEFSFIFSDVPGLRTFLDSILEDLEDQRGPKISAASFVFLAENCEELEARAMQAAFDDARARAAKMAAILGKTPGNVVSISEQISARGANSPAESCIGLEMMDGAGGYSAYQVLSNSGRIANSMLKVEVGIMLNATFTLESDQ